MKPRMALRKLLSLTSLCAALTMGGCATLTLQGGKQDVKISSTPPGASITIDNVPVSGKTTPFVAELSRKKSHIVKLELPGYKPHVVRVSRGFNLWALFDLIPYWVYIARPVDWITGGLYRLNPVEIVWVPGGFQVQPGLVGAAISEDKMLNVAVADLTASGVSSGDAAVVADLLRGELVKTGVFNVVEKGNMERVLAEQAFQQTGCTSQECAVKLGKLLNVQRMIVGSFGKLLGRHFVSIRVVDVETGKVVYADEAKGDTVDQIDAGLRSLAVRIATRVK